jgi:16S rRNA (uracil1498-N3)-methyltransferase
MDRHPATRLYIAETLVEGATAALDEGQAHRLRNVLRLSAGAVVAAFNPRDGELLCEIAELRRGGGRLSVLRRLRAPEHEPDLWLLFAPIKRARLDWLIEKATELGVAAFTPVWTARTQPERLNTARLQAHAVAAAEQSERLSVPAIHTAERLDRLLAAWTRERRLIVCDESGGGAPATVALASVGAGPAALLVGPEGGFTETELDAFGILPFVSRMGLGPRVLRAETAALAAVAVFQAIAGDWRRVRSG